MFENYETILSVLFNHELEVFPLHSVIDGKCSCRNVSCSSPGKHPLLRANWKAIATSNKERIKHWFSRFQSLNFAVATGRKLSSGGYLVVIDIDKEDHSILKDLPKTFSYKTGSGGYHFWYRTTSPIKSSVGLLPSVDVRGENGYVVIPPSKHISGRKYKLLAETTVIEQLPEGLLHRCMEKKVKSTPKTTVKARKQANPSEVMNAWSNKTAKQLKEMIVGGEKIPVGVRNVVLHRLLSSDRALGLLSKHELQVQAAHYLSSFEDKDSFQPKELEAVVSSVFKYPAYNNSHEKVNHCYCRWLEKQNIEIPAKFEENLTKADDEWFSSLNHSEGSAISLAELMEKRRWFLYEKLGTTHISEYKPALFGKKLRALGHKRRRTSRENKWLISVPNMC